MAGKTEWQIPPDLQPKTAECPFDLETALAAMVAVQATVPEHAFTAGTLGTEREGNGVVIREDGLILTIGYVVTEAETIWLRTADGGATPGHVLAYDQATGFGLVQALGRLNVPALPLGRAADLAVGEQAIVAAAGGKRHALKVRIAARQEFAGYWEYVLDEAIFTAPAHPFWGGAALIDEAGRLCGIGSLHVQQGTERGTRDVNMIVPIDLLPPILDDLLTLGRVDRPPRPWLGLYATEDEDRIVVAGIAADGPAARAGVEIGDRIEGVAGEPVTDLVALWRLVWATGDAGAVVPLELSRQGRTVAARIASADRASFLTTPKLH
jgi:S1-C subfamily serine protease